jgi:hypothetical protein
MLQSFTAGLARAQRNKDSLVQYTGIYTGIVGASGVGQKKMSPVRRWTFFFVDPSGDGHFFLLTHPEMKIEQKASSTHPEIDHLKRIILK